LEREEKTNLCKGKKKGGVTGWWVRRGLPQFGFERQWGPKNLLGVLRRGGREKGSVGMSPEGT